MFTAFLDPNSWPWNVINILASLLSKDVNIRNWVKYQRIFWKVQDQRLFVCLSVCPRNRVSTGLEKNSKNRNSRLKWLGMAEKSPECVFFMRSIYFILSLHKMKKMNYSKMLSEQYKLSHHRFCVSFLSGTRKICPGITFTWSPKSLVSFHSRGCRHLRPTNKTGVYKYKYWSNVF